MIDFYQSPLERVCLLFMGAIAFAGTCIGCMTLPWWACIPIAAVGFVVFAACGAMLILGGGR